MSDRSLIGDSMAHQKNPIAKQKDSVQEVNLGKQKTGTSCVIPACKGAVVKDTYRKPFADSSQRVLGTRGIRQIPIVTEFFYDTCGIMYRHPPK